MKVKRVVAVVLAAMVVASCSAPGDEPHAMRKAEVKEHGGGTVLIEADDETCWELYAHDERVDEGRSDTDADTDANTDAKEDLLASEEETIDEATKVETTGCGPAEVPLSEGVDYGSVALAIDAADNHLHPIRNFALVLWLTRKALPVGGFRAKPKIGGERYFLYRSAPSKTMRGRDDSAEEIADWSFGNVADMRFNSEESERLRQAGLDPDIAGRRIRPLVDDLMALGTDVAGFREGLDALRAEIVAANTVRAIGRREVTEGADRDYRPSPLRAVLKKVRWLESRPAGGSWTAEARGLRRFLADQRFAEIRDDLGPYSTSADFRRAQRQAEALVTLDPTRAKRWQGNAARWGGRAASLSVKEARERAAIERQLSSSGGGGGSFNVPGWACPTRWC